MPTGPKGEKRPPDVIANAVHVMRIATGEVEDTYATAVKSPSGGDGNRTRNFESKPQSRTPVRAPSGVARSDGSPA